MNEQLPEVKLYPPKLLDIKPKVHQNIIKKSKRKMNNQKIHKLPSDLINKIAAGEVVERPASIVKELLENALDAKADQIDVELENGGVTYISITDNGIGLPQDQFSLLFERHATSKIGSLQDLEENRNLGFRGEALASISSVAKIRFASFPDSQQSGYEIDNSGEIKPVAMPQGTQIEVKDLFYNVPVRKKYLKTENTEYKKCLQLVEQYAICHPKVQFRLSHNQKQIFIYPKTDKKGRIKQIHGASFSDKLMPVFYSGADLKIDGFISKPELAVSKSPTQHFLINGRPIRTHTFNYAVKQAFGSLIFPQEKPQFFLWLNLNPTDVDMNVHPRKIEARFHFEGIIFRKIIRAVKKALENNDLTKKLDLPKSRAENYIPSSSKNYTHSAKKPLNFKSSSNSFKVQGSKGSLVDYFNQNRQKSKNINQTQSSQSKLNPLVQIQNSYILAQAPESIVIIDQHAAHERVLYEKFKTQAQQTKPQAQSLLTPIQVELTQEEVETLNSAQAILNNIGFDIAKIGGNSVAISSVPLKFSKNDLDKVLKGLLEDIKEEGDFNNLSEIEDIVINYAACRGAIKFGQPLTKDEMIALIQEMEKIEHKQYSCPHGRPSKVEITFKDLEKQFKRTK